MTPRFLITGGAGFIGCNRASALLADGVEVTVFDCVSSGFSGPLKAWECC